MVIFLVPVSSSGHNPMPPPNQGYMGGQYGGQHGTQHSGQGNVMNPGESSYLSMPLKFSLPKFAMLIY